MKAIDFHCVKELRKIVYYKMQFYRKMMEEKKKNELG